MPDISALNGTAIDSVAEFDGLTVTAAVAFTGLLDTYTGAAAGYSTRRLASSATVLMRVRRETAGGTGDDDEADVAYDSNNELSLDSAISNASALVTATTLGQFLNVGTVNGTTYTNPDSLTVTASCFVDEWKDQSGNANHATQGTPSNQPQIHSGLASTDLILENGKPAIASTISTSLTMSSTISVRSLFSAQKSTLGFLMGYSSGAPYHANGIFYLSAAFADSAVLNGNNYENSTLKNFTNVTRSTSQVVVSMIHTGTVSANQISQDRNTSNSSLSGTRQELILWSDDQSSNRTGIEQNINSEFLIYQPTDAPTSGLLATYTGAAAAYSVRQLSDKAVICMRIRRDMGAGNPGDDDETNIGFDANGDLDTQAIADFCTTGTGYVTRWWDQSVNGNHADQPVGGTGSNAFQPQIYNGTAVLTENGKPALDFDGTNDRLTFLNSGLDIGSLSSCVVGKFNSLNQTAGMMQLSGASSNKRWYSPFEFSSTFRFGYTTTTSINGGASDTSQHLFTMMAGSTLGNASAWIDGVFKNSTTLDSGISGSGGIGDADSTYADCRVQEVIVWGSDQSTNRTGIESDIDTYFQIP